MEWITHDDGEDEEDEVEAAFAPERQTCRSYPGKEEAEENRDENGGFVSVAKGGGKRAMLRDAIFILFFPPSPSSSSSSQYIGVFSFLPRARERQGDKKNKRRWFSPGKRGKYFIARGRESPPIPQSLPPSFSPREFSMAMKNSPFLFPRTSFSSLTDSPSPSALSIKFPSLTPPALKALMGVPPFSLSLSLPPSLSPRVPRTCGEASSSFPFPHPPLRSHKLKSRGKFFSDLSAAREKESSQLFFLLFLLLLSSFPSKGIYFMK